MDTPLEANVPELMDPFLRCNTGVEGNGSVETDAHHPTPISDVDRKSKVSQTVDETEGTPTLAYHLCHLMN